MAKKKKPYFTPFQGRQMYKAVMEMLLKDPALFEQMPGMTQEQRECYEAKRKRLGLDKLQEAGKEAEEGCTGSMRT